MFCRRTALYLPAAPGPLTWLGQAQRLEADDAMAACLYQPTWITVAKTRLQGVGKAMPVFANDLAALSWR